MAVAATQIWTVRGMTCNSCVRSIEAAVGALDGVAGVGVSLADGRATIAYSVGRQSTQTITAAIEDCGFDAAPVDGSLRHRVALGVRGMTCQSCVKSIEAVLGDTAGVTLAEVSLADERAAVEWDPAVVAGVHSVIEAIEGCGFDVDAAQPATEPAPAGATLMLARIAVDGMTCQSCVSSVALALRDAAGVVEPAVELAPRGLARIRYDPRLTDARALVAAIEDAGFGAALEADAAASAEAAEEPTPAAPSGRAFGASPAAEQTRPLLGSATPQRQLAARSFSSTKSGETLLDGDAVDVTGSHIATQFEVHGMSCASCVAAIERGLGGRDGVHSVSVSLLAQRATVQHDSSIVSDRTIARWIEELGFEAKPLDAASRVARIVLNVYGMTCASCVALVERTVGRAPGVASVSVSLALETAAIEYAPSEIGVRKLVALVEGAGFDALVAEGTANNTQLESLQRTRDILAWRRRFVHSLWFSIPVVVLAKVAPHVAAVAPLVHWQAVPGLPLGALLQLVLTTPLQFVVGARFYANAFKAVRHGNANMDVLVTTGTSLAYFFSLFMLAWSVFHGRHPRPHCFFEAPAMLITFVSLGRYLENLAKGNASAAL
ncbi:Cu(2+)-transporting P-type ATPase, partial [Coemansia helicoidea]